MKHLLAARHEALLERVGVVRHLLGELADDREAAGFADD